MAFDIKQFANLDFDNIGEWPVAVRWFFVCLTFAVVLFIGYKLDISSQLTTLSTARQQEPSLKSQYQITAGQLTLVKSNDIQLEEMKKRFNDLLDDLPRNFNIPALLDGVSRVGKNNGLRFKLLKPSKEQKFEFYAVVPITIIAVGDYHQLAKFVSDVAHLEQPLRFTNLRILPVNADKKHDNKNYIESDKRRALELDLTAEVYRYTGAQEVKHAKS